MRRVLGVLLRPWVTMDEVARRPAFLTTWILVLVALAICGGLLLSTEVGQQALVDERVRVREALGQRVDEVEYERLRANPPHSVYLTSGGRLLLTPPLTVLVALGLMVLGRLGGAKTPMVTALSIAVHATVVLALQQIVATPLHYLSESLTNPTSVAGLLGVFDEGTWPSRLFGTIDVFGLWWMWLLSIGLAAAAGRGVPGNDDGQRSGGRSRRMRRYFLQLLGVYVGVAAIVAALFAVTGAGS